MKSSNLFIVAALLLAGGYSCSKEKSDTSVGVETGPDAVSLFASTKDVAPGKLNETSSGYTILDADGKTTKFVTGDSFGLFADAYSNSDPELSLDADVNVQFDYKNDSDPWTVIGYNNIKNRYLRVPTDGSDRMMYAYYPYNRADLSSPNPIVSFTDPTDLRFELIHNQSLPATLQKNDILIANKVANKVNNNVKFTFSHAMTKLLFNVKLKGDNRDKTLTPALKQVSVEGFATGSINLTSSVVTPAKVAEPSSNTVYVSYGDSGKPLVEGADPSFTYPVISSSLIVPPITVTAGSSATKMVLKFFVKNAIRSYDAVSKQMVVKDIEYLYEVGKNSSDNLIFTSGKCYTYVVTISNSGLLLSFTDADGNILVEDWATPIEIDTDPVIDPEGWVGEASMGGATWRRQNFLSATKTPSELLADGSTSISESLGNMFQWGSQMMFPASGVTAKPTGWLTTPVLGSSWSNDPCTSTYGAGYYVASSSYFDAIWPTSASIIGSSEATATAYTINSYTYKAWVTSYGGGTGAYLTIKQTAPAVAAPDGILEFPMNGYRAVNGILQTSQAYYWVSNGASSSNANAYGVADYGGGSYNVDVKISMSKTMGFYLRCIKL